MNENILYKDEKKLNISRECSSLPEKISVHDNSKGYDNSTTIEDLRCNIQIQ